VCLPLAPFSFGRLNAGFRPGADICGRGDIMGCGAYRILTNNPLVKERLGMDHRVDFREIPVESIFEEAQAYAAAGHELLSHPLSGSVKPVETPYKSLMIAEKTGERDERGLMLLARAREACGKFRDRRDSYDDRLLHDFQLIDCSLIESAAASADTMN